MNDRHIPRDVRLRDTTLRRTASNARSPSERLEPARAPAKPRGSKVAPPSRRLSGFVRFLSGMLTVLVLVTIAAAGTGLVLYHEFEKPGPLAVARSIVIPKGEGRIEIAERLEREGIISNRWVFVASHVARASGASKRAMELKAGEYEIKAAASMRDVMETLAEGKSILYKITIPEGLTSRQIVERLRSDPSLTGEIISMPAEGSLLPDTYRFSKGTARDEIILRMQAEMDRAVQEAWSKRKADIPIDSKEKAVIFASIVEKETGRADERDRVAAVFANRIKKNMRLQSDPTIIYGIAGGEGSLGRSITRSDIDQKTPYNTYQINGLPPTPICNPGRSAIEASLNPAETKDLYFVADGTGGHDFSETLKEHNAAVANWRKVEKEAKAARQENSADPTAKTADDVAPSPGDTPIAGTSDLAAPDPAPASVPSAKASAVTPASTSNIPLPVRKPKKTQ